MLPLLAFIAFVAFLTAYPLSTVLIQSFQVGTPGEPTVWSLAGYREVFSNLDLIRPLGSTFVIAIADVFIATLLAVGFAWLVTRTDLPYRGLIEFGLWMGMFIPQVSQSLGWILLLDPNYGLINKAFMALPFVGSAPFNIYSYGGIIWALLAFSTSMRFILITPAFRRLDGSAEEASRMSGANTWTTVRRVTVPILLPTILAASILGLIRAVEGFETALLLGTPARIEVFATKVYRLVTLWNGPNFTQAAALSTVFLAIIVVLIWLYNRSLAGRSFTTVTGKMPPQAPVRLGKWKPVILAFVVLYFVVLVALPIVVTLFGTFMTLFGFFNIAQPYTLDHWGQALNDPMLVKSIGTTVLFGAFSAVLGAFLYLVISYLILRTELPGRRVLNFFSWLPWSMPSILLGLGLLWMFLGNPVLHLLYGTIFAFGLAIVIKETPLGIQMTRAALLQHSADLEEAGRISGAGFWFRLRTIILPLMAPALTTIALLTFVAAARDVATISLLSTGSMRTLSLLTVDYVFSSNLGAASVSGFLLVLVIMAAAGVAAFVGRGRQLR